MAIKQFNRDNLQIIRPEIEKALKGLSDALGIEIALGSGRFSPTNATFKLELSVKDASGTVINKERSAFIEVADLIGMKAEWIDKTFSFGGVTYKIEGYKSKSRKAPIIASNPQGKPFKFDINTVVRLMGGNAKIANAAAQLNVIGRRNPDHDEIVRRLNELRSNNPEAYYADGEHRAAGATEKQIHDMHYIRIAREIADERSGKSIFSR